MRSEWRVWEPGCHHRIMTEGSYGDVRAHLSRESLPSSPLGLSCLVSGKWLQTCAVSGRSGPGSVADAPGGQGGKQPPASFAFRPSAALCCFSLWLWTPSQAAQRKPRPWGHFSQRLLGLGCAGAADTVADQAWARAAQSPGVCGSHPGGGGSEGPCPPHPKVKVTD